MRDGCHKRGRVTGRVSLPSVVNFQHPLSHSISSFNVPPTDYPHHTMAPRPGPLRDLPLERFIDVPFTSVPTTPRRTHKRSLSPGTPSLFSPTKRRILAQEGIFSPEKTIKSSIAPSDRAVVIHDVLRQSPALKLDFGQSLRSDSKVASTSCLFQEFSRPSHRHDRSRSSLPIPNTSSSQLPSIPSSSPNPLTNINYPGFDVWVDRDPNPSSLSSRSSSNNFHDSDEDKENSYDDKENVHPRTKWQTGLSKRLQRVSFASPDQSRRPNTSKIPFTPLNARSPRKARLPCELTPGKAPKVDRDEMKWRRELLAMELDGDDDSDDDL